MEGEEYTPNARDILFGFLEKEKLSVSVLETLTNTTSARRTAIKEIEDIELLLSNSVNNKGYGSAGYYFSHRIATLSQPYRAEFFQLGGIQGYYNWLMYNLNPKLREFRDFGNLFIEEFLETLNEPI